MGLYDYCCKYWMDLPKVKDPKTKSAVGILLAKFS